MNKFSTIETQSSSGLKYIYIYIKNKKNLVRIVDNGFDNISLIIIFFS